MKELPKKLPIPIWDEQPTIKTKINEILDYLESQKEGEEPKQIDVKSLLDEYYECKRDNYLDQYGRQISGLYARNHHRMQEIINTLKALQQQPMNRCTWKHDYHTDGHRTHGDGDYAGTHWKCHCGAKNYTRLNEPLDSSAWLQKLCWVIGFVVVCFLPAVIIALQD